MFCIFCSIALFCVFFVCKCVLYYCATRCHSIVANKINIKKNDSDVSEFVQHVSHNFCEMEDVTDIKQLRKTGYHMNTFKRRLPITTN